MREIPVLEVSTDARLRRVVETDREAIEGILREPSVAQWWTTHSLDDVIEDSIDAYVWAVDQIIEGTWTVVGGVQAWENANPEYRHAGIDLFLATSAQGHGLGRAVVRTVSAWLFDVLGHHRIVIDPAAANERAIRAYAAVGFQRVGVMRQYEQGRDGTWHDGLLMDLLREDLLRD
jgi:aminoglycoside 6'-N-acetyltransferase